MSSLITKGNASGTGSVTLESPNTNSDFTISLPASAGTAMVSGNMPTFYSYSSGARTVTGNGTEQKVVLNNESWDTANCFDSTTNYRFTPNVAGYYQINMSSTGSFSAISGAGYLVIIIYKNGSAWSSGAYCTSLNGNYWNAVHSNIVYLNGTTDYVEMYIATNNNGTYTQQNQGTTYGTFMSGALIRSA